MKETFLILALITATTLSAQTKKYQIANGLIATINHAQGSKTVQVLMPGVETIELDLTQAPGNVFMIKTADYNFDGFKDFAFMSVNQASGTQVYDIFLYHPAEKTFEALEVPGGVCEAFGNVRLGAGDKTLKSGCRNGTKASQDIFKWTATFTLELVKSTDNSADALQERAEEKGDVKTEKAEQRKDKRNEIQEKKEQKKDERDEKKEKDDDD